MIFKIFTYISDMKSDGTWAALSALASSQHGVFTRQQAGAIGHSKKSLDHLVKRGAVSPVDRGVLCFIAVPRSWRSALMSAVLAGGGSQASHRSAACLHELDGFDEPQPIEVTVARGRYPARGEVIVHRWTTPDQNDFTQIDNIPVSSVASTLARLGAVVPSRRVEQALDDALRRGYSLKWIQQTTERLHRPGPTGTGVLLRLLRDRARQETIPDSVFERVTARVLAATDLASPVLQHPVRLPNGRTARIDIAWPSVKWGIECHSRRYHFGPARAAADHDRDHQLAMAGWHLTYLTWHQLQDPDYVIELARTMLAQRAVQSASPPIELAAECTS